MIRTTLLELGLIDVENIVVISDKTRDNNNLKVYQDKNTKIIFIDDYYVGNDEYKTGDYRTKINGGNYEDYLDSQRRWDNFKQFAIGKSIIDFGCGNGSFLMLSKQFTRSSIGVEMQDDYREILNHVNIKCYSDLSLVHRTVETVFLFHVLEHLPDPINTLKQIHSKLSDGGKIIIEVPHAKDYLMDNEKFLNFTLWSQHLILHTRESLEVFLKSAGFKNIIIKGVQRYGLSNHLQWLKYGISGGHVANLSIFESKELKDSYTKALESIDATDTLIVVATK